VNPGAVQTNIWWYLRGIKKFIWRFFIGPLFLLTSKQGCQTSVHAATVEYLPSGPVYYTPYKQMACLPFWTDYVWFTTGNGSTLGHPDPRVYKEEAWAKLWEFSEESIKPYL